MDDEEDLKIAPSEFAKLRHGLIRGVQFAFILLLFGWGLFYVQGLIFDKKAPPPASAVNVWSPPAGYIAAATQEDIAYGYKWLAQGEYKCILFQRCVAVGVVSSHDCPEDLSIEAVLLDKSGEKVGKTKGTAPLVTANEKVRVLLTLDSAEAVSARVSRAMCH